MSVTYSHESKYDKVDSITSNASVISDKFLSELKTNGGNKVPPTDYYRYDEKPAKEKVEVDKIGVILAAGKNSRVYPASCYLPKALFPIANRPAIFFAISQMLSCGVKYISIVANDDDYLTLTKIARYYTKGDVHIFVVMQKLFNGPIDAIATGLIKGLNNIINITEQTSIYLYFADNIFICSHSIISNRINDTLTSKEGETILPDVSLLTYPTNHPERYGIIVDLDGGRFGIVEKPEGIYGTQQAVVGFYRYSNRNNHFMRLLVKYCEKFRDTKIKLSITDFNNDLMKISGITAKASNISGLGSRVMYEGIEDGEVFIKENSFIKYAEYDKEANGVWLHISNSNDPNTTNTVFVSNSDLSYDKTRNFLNRPMWFDIGTYHEYKKCCETADNFLNDYPNFDIGCPEIIGSRMNFYDIDRDFSDHIKDPDYMCTKYVQNILDYKNGK